MTVLVDGLIVQTPFRSAVPESRPVAAAIYFTEWDAGVFGKENDQLPLPKVVVLPMVSEIRTTQYRPSSSYSAVSVPFPIVGFVVAPVHDVVYEVVGRFDTFAVELVSLALFLTSIVVNELPPLFAKAVPPEARSL